MKKNIAVVAGGYTSEFEISLKSAQTVLENLSKEKYNSYLVVLSKKRWFVKIDNQEFDINKGDFSFNNGIEKISFNAAFIIIHGSPGEDGKVQSYFDLIGLPYAGPSAALSSLTFNKAFCNKVLKTAGFNVADSILLLNKSEIPFESIRSLGLPCFVKPNDSGSSFGVTKVKKHSEIQQAIDIAFQEGEQVIIESFLDGREFTCGVSNYNGFIKALPVTEIIAEGEFFDYAAKYEGKSREVTPAEINEELKNSIQKTSEDVYKFLGLNGTVRVDFIIHNNKPHIIEINSNPGLSKESIIPQMANSAGIKLSDLFEGVIDSLEK